MKMKKILLCSAALVGVAFAAAPAMAQVDVTVGGHTKNYVGFADQDSATGQDSNDFDMLRESELHFNAEGTADNGLTYGFHVESEVDGGDTFDVEESYLYLASSLGRVNLGSEDGANYLLQVAAPSADANIDGLRQYIQPVNYTTALLPIAQANQPLNAADTARAAANAIGGVAAFGGASEIATLINFQALDYANDATGQAEKITYLSPNWSGFQFGLSYTPDVGNGNSVGTAGFASSDVEEALGDGYEGALRYEGTFNNIGFALGAGYTQVDVERDNPQVAAPSTGNSEDVEQFNLGADFDIGAFGVGAAYTETDNVAGVANLESETYVIGGDYTTGPFQFGISYLNNEIDLNDRVGDIETDRYTGGVVYTVTQGLTLRGSVSYVDHELPGVLEDVDATSVMGGVQFNF